MGAIPFGFGAATVIGIAAAFFAVDVIPSAAEAGCIAAETPGGYNPAKPGLYGALLGGLLGTSRQPLNDLGCCGYGEPTERSRAEVSRRAAKAATTR